MFRKLHTTGRNNFLRIFALLSALILLVSMPLSAAAEESADPNAVPEYTVTVSGFELNFDVNKDYYLIQPESFENCSIISYTGFSALTVSVEQYATYFPYQDTPYVWGEPLKLGHGRAKLTLNATLKDGSVKEYLIALTDPNALDYAYARARVTNTVNVRKEPNTSSDIITTLYNNARVYYLKTEGDWCMVQLINHVNGGRIGYIHKDYLRWDWLDTEMPAQYAEAINALKAAHPNWSFTFVDVEMTYAEALEKYGSANEQYINPTNYLTEDKIFAFLDIDSYDQETWSDDGIRAIWVNESAITKDQAVEHFSAASKSLLMNPYYIACRAALESGYGTSAYARGMTGVNVIIDGVTQYVDLGGTYYNLYGIGAYDNNPNNCMLTARDRNWCTLERSIVEGANWIKDQYLDQGATTPYFFRFRGFQNKVYMSDVQAPLKEASILKKAYTDPNAKAHFIVPVYAEFSPCPFTDVKAEDYFYEPVLWAVENKITTGTTDTTFGPTEVCERGQIVTFLWRAAGSPTPTASEMTFTDVAKDAYYYDAVLWAVENKITTGTTATTFGPTEVCERGQIVTFLWRAFGCPEPKTTEMPFTDVAKDAYYYNAVLWAVENKITTGTTATTFGPTEVCERGQIVTFLYRAYQSA
ncbi:MAG: S-layer homology domain-containing protein [Clostridia bacterium]|nr:S-layer homology domain-containing protein [Clostridia bacterium]